MEIKTLLEQLKQNLIDTSYIEIIAVFFGLLSVWYAKKESIRVYPTGIINVLIYVYLCFSAGLYGDMGINAFYFVMSVYGWYNWSRKDENSKEISITRCNKKELIFNMLAFLLFFGILWFILERYTPSTVPVLDSFTTALFIIAMWQMARKKIENWIAWIIGDALVIPMFAYKELIFTSFQFIVFLILAISGYLEWRKKLMILKKNIG
ncbi:MAG: nicotinamide riboside transporter PnuC [Lentimicrobiaceae bacterium]|nr:nicotinamide riboside transporter PnuC [Lentimicrobiaceae bacterium]